LTTDEVHKTIDEGQAAVDVARSALTLAKQDYDRFTELYKLNAVALRRSQEVTQAYDAATAEVQLAGARLAKAEAARTRIEVSNADLEVARREVEKASKALALADTGEDRIREAELLVVTRQEMVHDARIAVDSAEHLLAFTKVRAPFKGVVVKRYRSLGDSLSAGVPLLSMYNADLLYVTANLEETRLRGVAPGNSVTLDLDAFERPFRGRVVWINKSTGAQFALMPRNVVSGEFTKVVQRVPVRILIEKDDRWAQLRSGLSVEVCIAHGSGDAAWAAKAAQEMAAAEAQFNRPAQD
jgi:membrane fusion protein (multidrug efflux system)